MRRALAIMLLASACATARPAAPPPRPTGVLLVRCPNTDASLWVDDRFVGEVGHLPAGVRLPAGEHLVELRQDGYHTRYAEVSLAAGQSAVLDLTLAEALP